jgi:hypothetical protein
LVLLSVEYILAEVTPTICPLASRFKPVTTFNLPAAPVILVAEPPEALIAEFVSSAGV